MADKEILAAWIADVQKSPSDAGRIAIVIATGNSTVADAVASIRDCARLRARCVRPSSPQTALPESLLVLAADLERKLPNVPNPLA